MKIYSSKDGYQRVYVGKVKCYHYVLAQQFIPNSDPKVYTDVNHKNHIRDDNRLDNLEWITHRDNLKNRQSYTKRKIESTNEKPVNCIPITDYKGYKFKDYYFDPDTNKILKYSRGHYHYMTIRETTGTNFSLIDIHNSVHNFGIKSFIKYYQEKYNKLQPIN